MESIEEKNKIIAEFLGYTVYNKRYPRNHGIGGGTERPLTCILEKLKYHSSWDCLMPVVKKQLDYLRENQKPDTPELIKGLIDCDIEAIHEACYQFIKQIKK